MTAVRVESDSMGEVKISADKLWGAQTQRSLDVAVGFGGAGGYLEMNVYKPLIIFNITHSIAIMADGCVNFRKFLIEGAKPNLTKIKEYVDRSLMLVTATRPRRSPTTPWIAISRSNRPPCNSGWLTRKRSTASSIRPRW
jgi:fumarate hydratase class II